MKGRGSGEPRPNLREIKIFDHRRGAAGQTPLPQRWGTARKSKATNEESVEVALAGPPQEKHKSAKPRTPKSLPCNRLDRGTLPKADGNSD